MKNLIITLLICTIAFNSCTLPSLNCFDGPIKTKELNLNSFHKIDIDFPCEIILTKGDTQKIIIEAAEDFISDLESRSSVSNDTWKARIRSNCLDLSRNDVKIILTVPDIEEIKADGNVSLTTDGKIDLNANFKILVDGNANINLKLDILSSLIIDADGNAKITLDGAAQELSVNVDGNTTINAHDFVTKFANIKADGNAKININTTDTLEINIDGLANICYKSHPTIISNIDGLGTIKDCN